MASSAPPGHAEAPPGAASGTVRASLVIGTVRHQRLRPAVHGFTYPTFSVLLPMRAWAQGRCAPALPRNRWGWAAFHDRDHGDGGGDALAWLDRLLAEYGVRDADGEAWLQTYPRVLGFVFKPVSFWYCHRADGRLRAIVAEVNNTFGERHCYLLDGPDVGWGRTLQAEKVFHVSPFFGVQGGYRFRFARTDTRLVARIEHFDDAGTLLTTSISGDLLDLDARHVRTALWRTPLLTFGVMARIHWQALQLWLKRVPFHRKPSPPAEGVTQQTPTSLRLAPATGAERNLVAPAGDRLAEHPLLTETPPVLERLA